MNLRISIWTGPLFASLIFANSMVAAATPAIRVGSSWTFEAHDGYGSSTAPSAAYRVDVATVSDAGIATRVTDLGSGAVSVERFTLGWNPVSAEWPSGGTKHAVWDLNEPPDRLLPGIRWGRQSRSNQSSSRTPATDSYVFSPPYPELPDRLEPGVNWKGNTESRNLVTGRHMIINVTGSVVGRERVHTPAGDFDTIKVERKTYLDDADYSHSQTLVTDMEWFAPVLGRSIKYSTRSERYDKANREGPEKPVPGDWTVYELSAYN
jgi:hypothetical protein